MKKPLLAAMKAVAAAGKTGAPSGARFIPKTEVEWRAGFKSGEIMVFRSMERRRAAPPARFAAPAKA